MHTGTLTVYSIEKEEVYTLQFKRIEQLIALLKKRGRDARNSLLITFNGYDHMVEEIYEIREIKRWAREFVRRNPDIFYFLSSDLQADQIILTAMSEAHSLYEGEPTKSAEAYAEEGINPADLPKKPLQLSLEQNKIDQIADAVTRLGERFEDEEGVRSSLAIFDVFKETEHE